MVRVGGCINSESEVRIDEKEICITSDKNTKLATLCQYFADPVTCPEMRGSDD